MGAEMSSYVATCNMCNPPETLDADQLVPHVRMWHAEPHQPTIEHSGLCRCWRAVQHPETAQERPQPWTWGQVLAVAAAALLVWAAAAVAMCNFTPSL